MLPSINATQNSNGETGIDSKHVKKGKSSGIRGTDNHHTPRVSTVVPSACANNPRSDRPNRKSTVRYDFVPGNGVVLGNRVYPDHPDRETETESRESGTGSSSESLEPRTGSTYESWESRTGPRTMSRRSMLMVKEVQSSVRRYEKERREVIDYYHTRMLALHRDRVPLYDDITAASSSNSSSPYTDPVATEEKEKDKRTQCLHSLPQWKDIVDDELKCLLRPDNHDEIKDFGKIQLEKLKITVNNAYSSTAKKCEKMDQKCQEKERKQDSLRKQKELELTGLVQRTEQLYNDLNSRIDTVTEGVRKVNSQLKVSTPRDSEPKQNRTHNDDNNLKGTVVDYHSLLQEAYKDDSMLF